jgi:hypothetical protein
VTKSSPKRFTQRQLTKIFCQQAEIPSALVTEMQKRWWVNPTDPNSLRLSMSGLSFVRNELKLDCYPFLLPEETTNQNLLQLERYFPSMYYLVQRKKLFVFEESEAVMLSLYQGDIQKYLNSLESTSG